MSAGAVVAIVVVAVLLVVLLAVALPRARGRSRERELARRRGEVAGEHRRHAEERSARADYAEQQARRERAEADLHQARARLHEHGLADEDLDAERERLADGERFDTSERDAAAPQDERR